MVNPRNNGHLIGRVAQEVKELTNSDGSKSILLTLAVDDNFTSGTDKKIGTNFIPLRAFVSNRVQNNPWSSLSVGSLIAVSYRVNAKSYTDRQGTKQYPMHLEVQGYPQFLESASTAQRRAQRHAQQYQEEDFRGAGDFFSPPKGNEKQHTFTNTFA
ncbi:single-stranded DNA-binding protein [Nocardiopsis synnemataformans]|uniref:single-stranded DNA-binding protein n=1 Tax=Nocardiopsis synnemataformans TaxID=61305 RepID=UPI003EBBB3DB